MRGEVVEVAAFIRALAEIFRFYQALFNKGVKAVVGLAQRYVHLPGELALNTTGANHAARTRRTSDPSLFPGQGLHGLLQSFQELEVTGL